MPRQNQIQIRKGSSSEWISQNPTLASGEPGYDLSNKVLKVGDGTSTWTQLSGINQNIVAGYDISVTNTSGIYTIASTNLVHTDSQQPQGFVNRTDSRISVSGNIFRIEPTGSSYSYYNKGVKVVKTSGDSLTIPNLTQINYIHFDTVNNQISNKTTSFDFSSDIPIAYVAWNSGVGPSGQMTFFAEERHGIVMDTSTHKWIHYTFGAQYVEGLSIGNYVLGGNGSSNSHATISIGNGTLYQEDIEINITDSSSTDPFCQELSPTGQIPVYYHQGSTGQWVKNTATNYPVKYGANGPQYNLLTGATWTTPDVSPGGQTKYFAVWILATNQIDDPIISIMGQRVDSNQGAAESNNSWSDVNLTNLPLSEVKPLYRLIFAGDSDYTNVPKCTLLSILDIRVSVISTIAGVTQNDHGNLFGLGDDDHSQYLHVDNNRTVNAVHNFVNGINLTNNQGTLNVINDSGGLSINFGGSETYNFGPSIAAFENSISAFSGNFTNTLTVQGTEVSVSGHTHSSSNITDFASSVSGLLPVGTQNYISKFGTSGSGVVNSLIFDNGTNVGIGTASPSTSLHVVGSGIVSGDMTIGGNLIVNGTTTTVNVDTVTIEDPIITLGLSSGNVVPNLTHDRGLALVRGTGLTAFMGWDTSASQFVILSSGIAGVNSGTYTAGTYGDLQLNKLNSAEINVNQLISIISSGISFSNFIKFSDSSTASGPSLGSVSNGTRLLLNENNTDGHNAIGIQYAGINGTWFSVPSGGTFTFYNGTAPQLTINSTSLNYGSLTASSDGSITSASWNASTIAVNKGGTGRTSYSNGQLLIGSGTSLIANTLSAGTGISITNGSGTITINTSGLQTSITNPVTGTGTTGKIPKWSSTTALTDSIMSESPTVVNIAGSFNGQSDDTYLSFDANARRIGITKKAGFTGKFTYGSGSSFAIAQSNSGTIEATNTFTDRLVINSVGNVGIGTATPQSKVHITDTNDLNTTIEYTNATVGFTSGVRPLKLLLTASNGVAVGAGVGIDFVTKSSSTEYTGARIISNRTDTSNNHALTFWAGGGTTSLSEYMRISSNGNVGIGTTTPAELLTVYGDSKYLYLQAQNNSGSAGIKFGNTSARQQMYIEGTSNDLVVDSMNGGVTESIRIGYNTGAVTINESGSDLDFRVEGDTDTNLVFVDASTDRVGIGTSSPGYKLQVNGSFAASTKSFRIHHPSKKDHSLEYGSLESPYHGVRLTGRGSVLKGVGTVSLPDYLKDLIHDDDTLNIQITNIKHGKTIYIDKIDLQNDRFIVKVDRAKSLGELQFFWTLSGVRKDVDHLVVEKRN